MAITDISALFADWVWPILAFLIGVGLVVFVHELGHFLAAKAVDVKVEKFAMGIGPRLWGFKRGETEYCLNLLLPLGGYLKMLGQDDVRPAPEPGKPGDAPAGAPAPAAPVDAAPAGPASDDPVRSPRAFQNKSVGARMLVISGGVVMNVILGAVLFLIVGLVGKPFGSPVIGGVLPGSPAAQARIDWQSPPAVMPTTSPALPDANVGLRAGDKIVRIDGDCFLMKLLRNDIESFDKVRMIAMLANDSDRYRLTIQRPDGNGSILGVAHMGVRARTSEMGTARRGFGIMGGSDTVVAKTEKTGIRFPGPLQGGDRVVSIAGHKIAHEWDIAAVARGLDGNAVDVGVLRDGNEAHFLLQPELRFTTDLGVYFDPNDGSRVEGAPAYLSDANLIAVRSADGTVRDIPKTAVVGGNLKEPLDILGMIPRMLVAAVIVDTPADKAGVQPGDILYDYGDVRTPSEEQIHQISDRSPGGETNLVVLRGAKSVGLKIAPKARPGGAEMGFLVGPDIAHPILGAIRQASPAAKAGLAKGDLIERVNGRPVQSWIDVFRQVRQAQGRPLLIGVKRGDAVIEANLGEVTRRFFDPADYELSPLGMGVVFEPLTVIIVKSNPLAAMGWGVNQTWEFILTSYATLRQLIAGTVSGKEAAGPVGVGQMAVLSARKGMIWLVYLMGIISASVAVVNFLPFPVLDGGHAAMLVLEKIRGKPLPGKVMWIMQLFGLACILVLFVLLTWNDIARIIHGM